MTLQCPEEEVLLSLVFGQPPSAEIQSHVESCDSCRVRVDQLRREVATLRQVGTRWQPVSAPAAPPPPVSDRPAVIGKYFIAGLLGEGGEAVVYRGLHPTLGKDVAIKWAKEPLSQAAADHQRLISEGKVLAGLEHANLVRVFDLDFHEGRPFLVMEFIRGGNLEELALRETKLSAERVAGLLAPLGRAVALAHRSGITHQDIKPRNILMHEDGQPLLSDFGLARLRSLPDAGPVGGTPGYMSPEQARGDIEQIGPRSDVFGLGGVLYFLLTRQPPFPGKHLLLVQQAAMQGQVDFTPLDKAGAPRGLAAICRKALAAKPEDRYSSGDAMADDLERFVRLPQRRRFLMAAGVGAAALTGLYFAWPRPVAPVEMPAGQQPLFTRISRGRLQLKLAGASPLRTGDEFQIECLVPAGTQAELFGLDAGQRFDHYTETTLTPAGSFSRLHYPREGKKARLGAGLGTEVLLVVASRSPPQSAQVEKLLRDVPWPALPDHAALVMNPSETAWAEDQRPLEVVPGDTSTLAKERMEKLRLGLLEAGYDYFAAVAFAHRD